MREITEARGKIDFSKCPNYGKSNRILHKVLVRMQEKEKGAGFEESYCKGYNDCLADLKEIIKDESGR